MRNYKYLLLMLLLGTFAFVLNSCDDDLVKSDFDYKPDASLSLAVIQLNSLEKASDESITLDATITNAGESEIYDQGFIYSTEQSFATFTSVSVEPDTIDSEVKVVIDDLKIAQGRSFYFKAFVLTKDGMAVSSKEETINLPVTWVRVADVDFTDNTISNETYPVELQKFEGQNRYRLVDPYDLGVDEYLVFELDAEGNAMEDKMANGAHDLTASGYSFYWHPDYVGSYCNFFNTANVYTIQFLLLSGGSLYTGGEFIFEWIDGYPGEIPEPRITDFNSIAYIEIPGEVGDFNSKAFYDSFWEQTISLAVDMDESNPESQYKNLFNLSDLYVDGYGLAFYYDGENVTIPESQPTGTTIKEAVYVSQSDVIASSVTTTAKGVKIYTLGLNFHYEDGTSLGDFEETFFYSEEAVTYEKSDFLGNFKLTGKDQFGGDDDADMDVTIEAGAEENEFMINGVDLAADIIATFNPETSVMSIAPQALPDYGPYDITMYTTDADGNISETATMDFTFTMQGNLVMTPTSPADGYLLNSDAGGGWVSGYYGLVFKPVMNLRSAKAMNTAVFQAPAAITKEILGEAERKVSKLSKNNFKVQAKQSVRKFVATQSF